MEECCAVCADPLVWVAYGPCGHRDVCSTCVVRLRFVLCDRRCCICKSECPTFFVTRDLGSFTETKVNFSELPLGVTEGQHGKYWYHEDSQTYFDDVDHYRMISTMCRLLCHLCDNSVGELRRESSNNVLSFKSIDQLKGHLYHHHRMFMCSLCLEGKKVFISEQKLYTRLQLSQHVSTGDSEVDGSKNERGGFTGHPMCEFCKKPFYGDTELYLHNSTEHFTCHICQRQHPGQYEYYRNYDDLEIHFREEHFLCENDVCLSKKFIVFQSDTEMKRHNAIEHGGHMSRSKRNAALQIPISFKYHRNEQNQSRGRRYGLHPQNSSSNQLTMAIQASLDTAFAENRIFESSHDRRPSSEYREATQDDEVTSSMGSLAISSFSEPLSSRFITSERHRIGYEPILQENSFPPLSNFAPQSSSSFTPAFNQRSNVRLREESFPPLPGIKGRSKPKPSERLAAIVPTNSAWKSKGMKLKHSTSSANLHKASPSSCSTSRIVSAVASNKESSISTESRACVEDFHRVNKSLLASICTSLEMDEDKYAAFESISAEYYQNLINTWEYLSYVKQFSLSHLVFELAQLCPDPQKERELINAYNASLCTNGEHENHSNVVRLKKDMKKGKAKMEVRSHVESSSAIDVLSGSNLTQVRNLQSIRPLEEVVLLTKAGYQTNKDKISSAVSRNPSSKNLNVTGSVSKKAIITNNISEAESIKKNKKMSKFLRIRLGDGSAALSLDQCHRQTSPEKENKSKSTHVTPAIGVWNKGGGKKLLVQKNA